MTTVHVSTPLKEYDILFEQNFDNFATTINGLGKNYSKIAIISDDKVASYYSEDLVKALEPLSIEVYEHHFPNGEINKNYKTINGFL